MGEPPASRAIAHGAFDDDEATLKATLARILGKRGVSADFQDHRSAASLRAVREAL
jgi:hypothetical protein